LDRRGRVGARRGHHPGEVLRRLFGTVELTHAQWALALVPAVLLFFIWELGKLIARRTTATSVKEMLATTSAE
jgi:hypothetical protein